MKPKVSIIIPHYNDVETVIETIDNVYDTIDIFNFEVIVVDDGSREKIPDTYRWQPNARYVSHFVNLGVGAAFDTGARLAKADVLFLMGGDVTFAHSSWASRMYSVIDKEDKAIVCTKCSGKYKNRGYYGADIVFYLENKDLGKTHPRKGVLDYRAVMEGKWRSQSGRGVYGVPSLMGAFYGVKKSWFEYIKGFELHYKWGSLEPYISLKSWMLGGAVYVDSENEVFHKWRKPQRGADYSALAYNQFMISSVVFGGYGERYANYLLESDHYAVSSAVRMFEDKWVDIASITRYVAERAVMSPEGLEEFMVILSQVYLKDGPSYKNPLV